MPDFFWNLWAIPPGDLDFRPCPNPVDPVGFYDPAAIRAAYGMTSLATALLVLLLIALCYLWTRSSLGPRFVVRWWSFMAASVIGGFLLGTAMVHMWPARALAGSCEANPESFPLVIPWAYAFDRGVAGAVWAALAFVLGSIVLTQVAGRFPWAGGLFHYRGCPYPRLMPFGE